MKLLLTFAVIHTLSGTQRPALSRASGTAPVTALAFSPDGQWLGATRNRGALLLEAKSGKIIARLTAGDSGWNALCFSRDGRRLFLAGGAPGRRGTLQVWECQPGKLRQSVDLPRDMLYGFALSPDGKQIAAGSYDGTIYVWAVNGDQPLGPPRILKDHTDAVYALSYGPGQRLASASADRTVKIWDADNARRLHTLSESTGELGCVAIVPRAGQVVAGGADRTLRLWRVDERGGELINSAFAHEGTLLSVLLTPDERHIITTGEDRLVKVWDRLTLHEEHVFEKQSDWPLGTAINPEGTLLAVCRFDGTIALYDLKSYARRWLIRAQ